MRRIACLDARVATLGPALAVALFLGLPGCGGGERTETGTVVETTDQMLKDAEASDAYFMEQQKAKGKRTGGS